jgi:molybdate transport system ATP-binding protein
MIRAQMVKRFDEFTLDVTIQADAGVTVLFGPSGAGKTLTLDCLAGFVACDAGRVLLDDRLLFDAAARVNLPPQQRHCGYVFQDHALFPHMTVRQNLLFAAERLPGLERHRRVAETMERFRIIEFAARLPHQLSGGQKQRCSVARSLIGQPRMLLLDEPAQGLDLLLRNELYEIVRQVRSEYKIPILLVTHDLAECFELGDMMLVLQAGKVLQTGAPITVYERPVSADVARLLGIANLFEAEVLALDPGRDTSRLRVMGNELIGPYLPGRLIGDRVRICVPASGLRVSSGAGQNCIPARLISITELPDTVRLRFAPEMTMEIPRAQYDPHDRFVEWSIEIPASAIRAAL